MDTPDEEKSKEPEKAFDAYRKQYLAAYEKLDVAVAALNADLAQAVAQSKENLAASQAEIEGLCKSNASSLAAADKKLSAAVNKAEKALTGSKEEADKKSAAIAEAHEKALNLAAVRAEKAAAAEKRAQETAEANKEKRDAAAGKADAETEAKAALARDEEKKRAAAVVKSRAAENKRIENEFAAKAAELKKTYEADVAALNNKIEAAQNEYFASVKSKTAAYEKSRAAKKTAYDAETAELTKKSQSADKTVMKEGLKGLAAAKKTFDRDEKAETAAFEADLASLKSQFVASVPPIEHKIFLRTNRYKIDLTAAEHAHAKAVDESSYAECSENENAGLNAEKCRADHEIALAARKHAKFCDAADYELETAAVAGAAEAFAAEEEFALTKLNLERALDDKRVEIGLKKAECDNAHAKNIAAIENECAKSASDADARYNILASEMNALFGSFAAYYSSLNEFDGTGATELSGLAVELESARVNASLSEDKAYALYGAVVGVCGRDCEKRDTGVLDDKIAKMDACEKNALELARTRYENEKASIEALREKRTAEENAAHAANIAALEKELADFADETAAGIAAAEKRKAETLAAIEARKAEREASDKKARADSESERKTFVQNKNAYLKKLTEDARAREAVKLAEIRKHAEELDAKLAAVKNSIEAEKKGENALHAKLTEKTIKALLKGCEIKPGVKWWVVDFSKK